MDKLDLLSKEISNRAGYDPRPYGQTDIGRVRRNNEDTLVLYDPDLMPDRPKRGTHRVYAVADGVGGRSGGEVASGSLVRNIHREAMAGRYIKYDELQKMNQKIERGASTLVLAQQLQSGNDYLIDSVGDSSPLLIDTHKGTVTELTRRDENSEGEVTQVMGPEGSETASFERSNRVVVRLREGQTLLLSTEGLTKYMDRQKIRPANLLTLRKAHMGDNEGFVRALITMANVQGGSDNITVVSVPFDFKYA